MLRNHLDGKLDGKGRRNGLAIMNNLIIFRVDLGDLFMHRGLYPTILILLPHITLKPIANPLYA